MGGDQDPSEVIRLARYIKNLYSVSASGLSSVSPQDGLKVAWYSGRPALPECLSGVAGPFDYIKLGPYIEALGGLKSEKTNQRLYKRVGDTWVDITSLFWRKNFE